MGHPPRRCVPAASLVAALVLLTTTAAAQTGGSEGLSPTLANIKRAHVVRLGYRESSPPFSFLDQANRPIGYSLELCEAIVEEIGVEVDDPNLKIEYVKVTTGFRRWCRTRSTSNADRPPPMRSAADRWRFRR